MKKIAKISLCLIMIPILNQAQTYTPKEITEDVTWSGVVAVHSVSIRGTATVTVLPGTHFVAPDSVNIEDFIHYFYVQGKLLLQGTAENPIVFEAKNIASESIKDSRVRFITIEYTGNLEARWVEFYKCYEAVSSFNVTPSYLYQCVFHDNTNDSVGIMGDVRIAWCTWIEGQSGVIFNPPGYLELDNCVFSSNFKGPIFFTSQNSEHKKAIINHLTSKANGQYGHINIYGPNLDLTIKNSIFTNNQNVIRVYYDAAKWQGTTAEDLDLKLDYNLAFNQASDLFVVYGDNPIYSFSPQHNENLMVADPLFTNNDPLQFYLRSNSPCIDAGDPSEQDPDGSRTDIGAIYYRDLAGVKRFIPKTIFSIDQTLVKDILTIEFNNPNQHHDHEARIFSLHGEILKVTRLGNSNNIKVGDLGCGLYYINIDDAIQPFIIIR